MGHNPIGSNLKPGTTIIFKNEDDLRYFKNAVKDLSEYYSQSPSSVVTLSLSNTLVNTDYGRECLLYKLVEAIPDDFYVYVMCGLAWVYGKLTGR